MKEQLYEIWCRDYLAPTKEFPQWDVIEGLDSKGHTFLDAIELIALWKATKSLWFADYWVVPV